MNETQQVFDIKLLASYNIVYKQSTEFHLL